MPQAEDLCVDIIKPQTGRLCQEGAGERPLKRMKACGSYWASGVRGGYSLGSVSLKILLLWGILFILKMILIYCYYNYFAF